MNSKFVVDADITKSPYKELEDILLEMEKNKGTSIVEYNKQAFMTYLLGVKVEMQEKYLAAYNGIVNVEYVQQKSSLVDIFASYEKSRTNNDPQRYNVFMNYTPENVWECRELCKHFIMETEPTLIRASYLAIFSGDYSLYRKGELSAKNLKLSFNRNIVPLLQMKLITSDEYTRISNDVLAGRTNIF